MTTSDYWYYVIYKVKWSRIIPNKKGTIYYVETDYFTVAKEGHKIVDQLMDHTRQSIYSTEQPKHNLQDNLYIQPNNQNITYMTTYIFNQTTKTQPIYSAEQPKHNLHDNLYIQQNNQNITYNTTYIFSRTTKT